MTCKDPYCSWTGGDCMGKNLLNSDMFEITNFSSEHMCLLELRHKDHYQASPCVIGHLIKNQYVNDGASYLPNNITL